jgi:hypothetical protein
LVVVTGALVAAYGVEDPVAEALCCQKPLPGCFSETPDATACLPVTCLEESVCPGGWQGAANATCNASFSLPGAARGFCAGVSCSVDPSASIAACSGTISGYPCGTASVCVIDGLVGSDGRSGCGCEATPTTIAAPTASNPPSVSPAGTLQTFVAPVTTPLAGGFQLSGMSYTIAATSLAPITFSWQSLQPWVQASFGTSSLSISSNDTVTISGAGTAVYVLSGNIDGQTSTQAASATLTGTKLLVLSQDSQNAGSLAAGGHVLNVGGVLTFTPAAIGETITVSSASEVGTVTVVAAAAPAPALPGSLTLVLAALLTAAGMSFVGPSRRRAAPHR